MPSPPHPNPALFRARWVVPVSAPPIEDGGVIVRGLTIEEVGRFSDLRKLMPAQAVVDLGEAVLLPGLVNCHTHLDNAALAGKTPEGGGDMIAWIAAQQGAWTVTSADERRAAWIAAWHSLPSLGTIAVADISCTSFERAVIGPEPLWGLVFYEVRGFGPERAEASFSRAKELRAAGAKAVSGVWYRFATYAHGPHSLHVETLRAVADEAVKRGDPFVIHLAESPEERGFLLGTDDRFAVALKQWGYWEDGFTAPGCSPVQYLKKLGALGPETIAVHNVQLDDADIATFAASGATACLCPRSNDYIGVGQPRVGDFISAGIPLCLGTDGLASAPSLSLFDEMAHLRRRHPGLDPAVVLHMATLGGARALRMDSLAGSLEMNKLGRFLAWRGDCGNDPLDALTAGVDHGDLTWVGGEIDLRP